MNHRSELKVRYEVKGQVHDTGKNMFENFIYMLVELYSTEF